MILHDKPIQCWCCGLFYKWISPENKQCDPCLLHCSGEYKPKKMKLWIRIQPDRDSLHKIDIFMHTRDDVKNRYKDYIILELDE